MVRNKNLIGVSGKIGSGKDTVGKILQYLNSECSVSKSPKYRDFEIFLKNGEDPSERNFNFHYQIKKFADKLKDMVCLLIGCTREQLEDQKFKEKPLGEEWDCLVTTSSYTNSIELSLPGGIEWAHSGKRVMTPRLLMQLLGTDCGRNIIHPNIWINSLFADFCSGFSQWVITDMRFKNEMKAVTDRGGVTIRINRQGIPKSEHPSETELDDCSFDYVIENNGTLEDLIAQVKNILVKEECTFYNF